MIYARSGFIYFSMSYEKSRFEPVKIMALKTIACRVSKALLVIFLCHPERSRRILCFITSDPSAGSG